MSGFSIFILILVAVFVAMVLWTRVLARAAERTVPMVGKRENVPGGAIHYVEMGPRDAQTLVMIHGLSGQMHNFTYGLTALLAPDFRVIVVDRPGCGYSTSDGDDLAALTEQARMIGALLDSLDVTNPVLVGHSLGGATALAMALDRPDKVAALALLCPLTQDQDTPPDVFKPLLLRSGFIRRLIGHTIAVPMAKYTASTVLAQVFKPENCPDDFLVNGGGALGMRPQSFVAASSDLVAVQSSMERQTMRYADELKTPGGVLFGADDAILSPAIHGRAMQAFGLSYDELPGRGHMIPITAPEECAEFVRRVAAQVA